MDKSTQIHFQSMAKVASELVIAGKTSDKDIEKVLEITKLLMSHIPGTPSLEIRNADWDDPLDAIVPMGKNMGKALRELPTASREWYINEMDVDPKFADTPFNRAVLELRKKGDNPDLEARRIDI